MVPDRKFKSGDIVMFKDGGPKMIVKDYIYGDILVEWLSSGEMVKGTYSEDSLKLAPRTDKLSKV